MQIIVACDWIWTTTETVRNGQKSVGVSRLGQEEGDGRGGVLTSSTMAAAAEVEAGEQPARR